MDTAYWGFLGVGTTFDIFQNILFPYSIEYDVLPFLDTAYWSCFLRGLWVDVTESDNASLRATIRTMEVVETVTRNHETLTRIQIERMLASVQESHRQDREDFKKLKELVTS
ncbi:hypothetical protein Tco_0996862 [Tanacetum coccineum]